MSKAMEISASTRSLNEEKNIKRNKQDMEHKHYQAKATFKTELGTTREEKWRPPRILQYFMWE